MTKSRTCKSRKNEYLAEYDSHEEAQESANFLEQKYGKKMVPYKCGKCGLWHLSPKERNTPSVPCDFCSKDSYRSEEDARKRARILEKNSNDNGELLSLRVYLCPHGNGWHLTSKGGGIGDI